MIEDTRKLALSLPLGDFSVGRFSMSPPPYRSTVIPMSFWKSLLGGGSAKSPGPGKPVREIEHNGYRIAATPYPEAGQFQVAGVITKEVAGAVRQHKFVRADRFGSLEEAADFAIMKGRQIIDQQGDRIFG
ncbi:MAG: HlyU family transcriptional regulator [Hyphomicrobiaceae bacterium]|nr:HlyU family transcriptional regulator [Hyphomicrobiaceae bacterium]